MELSGNTTGPTAGALYTYPELVFCAVGFCILIALAIVGNSLVLVAVARTKRLQNVTNVFVVNLSVCDCLSSFAFLWSVPGMVGSSLTYPLGSDTPCIASAALVFTTVGCSAHTLANIALNRCVLITRPRETYQWLYTRRKVALMVLVSWFVPLSATIIPPLSGLGDVGFDPESRTCTDIDTHPRAAVYDKIQFAAFFPLPLIVIVVSYVMIWRHTKQHFKKRRKNNSGWLQFSMAMPSVLSSASKFDMDDTNAKTGTAAGSLRYAESVRRLKHWKNDQLQITKVLGTEILT